MSSLEYPVTRYSFTLDSEPYTQSELFELEDIPPATPIQEIVEDVYRKVGIEDDHLENEVDLVFCQDRNELWRPLQRRMSVEESGLQADDTLVIISAAAARARYLASFGIHDDALRAGLPPHRVPYDQEHQTKVQQVFTVLEESGTLADLLMLACLRWPDDQQIRSIIHRLVPVGTPREVAPQAAKTFRPEDFEFFEQEFWNRATPSPPATDEGAEPATAAPVSPTALRLNTLIAAGIVAELAKCANTASEAKRILIPIEFPLAALPNFTTFSNFLDYWQEVCEKIDNGVMPSSPAVAFEELVRAAANQYPGNGVFKQFIATHLS